MPGNVCNSLIHLKGNARYFKKRGWGQSTVTSIMQKCQFKNGSFWNKNVLPRISITYCIGERSGSVCIKKDDPYIKAFWDP